MPLSSERCICLRKTEYSETSQILTLLTRNQGIVRVIAKGAHRRTKAGASRFDGGIDLLDTGQAIFTGDSGRELSILTDWKLLEGHLPLRNNLRSLYLAIYAAELVGLVLQEHDPHPVAFDLMDRLLGELASPAAEEAFLAFELDLLREAGFVPEFGLCIGCGNRVGDKEGVGFSPARGGMLCGQCDAVAADLMPFDVRLLRIVQMVQRRGEPSPGGGRLPRLTRHQTDPINRILVQHLHYTLGRPPRTAYHIVDKTPSPRQLSHLACNSGGPGA